ncbi:MAG: substrate-binding domain-containing protein [Lachnospiraceae bacterium]|nr:substrate-binding domain-containing protein [Lachnospiraceae bacterium]
MIGKGGKWLLFLYMAFLALLFLMCSTDLIIREPERDIYQIAIIIEDVRSDNYSNFRKGMDKAAMEFNVDVHFITLYEKADAGQQMEFMEREQQDGVDALIVVPADEEQVMGKPMTVPVIFLQPGFMEKSGAGSIVIDYEHMGKMLADEMLKKMPEECSVWMLTDTSKQSGMDRLFLKGAEEALTEAGYEISVIKRNEEDGFRSFFNTLDTNEKVVLLAENSEILTEVSGMLSDDLAGSEHICGLYGRGNTVPILNDLDRGRISGICVTDDFSIGYLSVRAAVQVLEGKDSILAPANLYYIEKENLREPDYEKLLFPIE